MRQLFFILVLLVSVNAMSQFSSTSRLLKISDSILLITIGNLYADFFELDTNSYYVTERFFKKEIKTKLETNDPIKGKFKLASIRYHIVYPTLKELSSTLFIIIHNSQNTEIIKSDIPTFILEDRDCDFVPRDSIIVMRDRLLKEHSIEINSFLHTDYKTGKLVWEFNSIVRKCTEGRFMDGLMETLKIDPYTGDIIEHYVGAYGHVF